MLAFAVACVLAGCVSTPTARDRAEVALENRSFVVAVERYQRAVVEHPDDADLRDQLHNAEAAWLDDGLRRFEAATNVREALQVALETLSIKDRIHLDRSEAQERRLDRLVERTGAMVHAALAPALSRGQALEARAQRQQFHHVLERAELAPVAADIERRIAQTGRATCVRATENAHTPFALELVASYCRAVNGPLPPAVHAGRFSGIQVAGAIPGDEADDTARALKTAFESSPWYGRDASARTTLRLEGAMTASFTASAPMTLTKSWNQRVPYVATVKRRVAVASTRTVGGAAMSAGRNAHLRSVSFGFPEVSYVDRNVAETQYRDEPRAFEYVAVKHHGDYRARVSLLMDLGGTPLELRHTAEDARDAFAHDADFAPAGLKPQRAELPTAKDWRQMARQELAKELGRSLHASYIRAFCTESVSTPEEAARCVRARPSHAPNAVRKHLEDLIGDDASRVLALP